MKKYQRCGSCGVSWPTFKAGSPKSRCANGHTTDRLVWVVQVTVDGKRKRTSFATEQEADIAMAEMSVAKATTGEVIPPQRMPFAQYVDEWVESRSTTLSENSIQAYRRAAKKVSRDPVGKIAVATLARADLRGFYSRLLALGLAVPSINQVAAVITGATAEAQAAGDARVNAGFKAWTPPKDLVASASTSKAFTREQMADLMDAAKSDELWPLWRLIATTAVRRGEALGLQWDDINLANRTIAVRRNMVSASKGGSAPITGTPKSGHSRTIPIDSKTADTLTSWRHDQNKRRLQSYSWVAQGWVFDRGGGVAWNPSTISMRFAALVQRAGITESIGIHGLRHSAATTLLTEGVPVEVVSKILGHSDVSITSAIYSHLTEETLAESAAKIARAIDG